MAMTILMTMTAEQYKYLMTKMTIDKIGLDHRFNGKKQTTTI
jgi:hypothetical protein